MSNRTVRVNELVQREISDILRKRYQSEAVAITISEVRVSPDLRDARVFVSVVGSEETAEAKLRWLRSKAAEFCWKSEHVEGTDIYHRLSELHAEVECVQRPKDRNGRLHRDEGISSKRHHRMGVDRHTPQLRTQSNRLSPVIEQ